MNKTSFLGDKPINRIGFGAMQLAGPGVFGPPRDPDGARAVLRRAVELGVDHIDTAQYYGPDVVNDLIRESLYPYPEDLKLVTKVGGRRNDEGAWLPAQSPAELRAGVEDNLRSLRVERMDLVNLRLMSAEPDGDLLAEQLGTLEDLRREGKLDLIGISEARRRHRPSRARPRRHRRGAERLQRRQPLRRGRARVVHRARDRVRALLPARVRIQWRPPGSSRRIR